MWDDIRLALRHARRRPAYAFTCVTVLALGVGVCTSVFAALYSAVLKPLPYRDPDRLVLVQNRFPSLGLDSMKASPADYSTLASSNFFARLGAFYFLDLSRTGIAIPQKVNAVAATASLFQTLGVEPALGRSFTDLEQRSGGPNAVILSDAYWKSAFGGDPGVLRRTLTLNREPYAIVGVMPEWFAFPNIVTEMWVPLRLRDPADARNYYLRVYARLAPGLKFAQADSRLEQFSRAVAARQPQLHAIAPHGWSYFLTPLVRDPDASARRWLWILFAAAACFLSIVCANVAGLVLVRTSERQFEFALRVALGAGKRKIVREVLTETLVWTAAGWAAALAVARLGTAVLAHYAPAVPPPDFEVPMFWFCVAASLLTGMLCGLYPAMRAAGAAAVSAAGGLGQGGFQRTAGRGQRRWHQALIVGQVALATALLVCGGLLMRSLQRLLQAPLGFDPRGVVTMEISLPPVEYASPQSRGQFFTAVLEKTAALPGVESASACTLLPFGYGERVNTFEIVGRPRQPVAPVAELTTVSSEYFRTMRIPLLRGRSFTPPDRQGPMVALIDQVFARRFFAGQDPVGRQVKLPWGVYQIVGVAGAVKASSLDRDSAPTLYFDAAQSPVTDMTLTIRGSAPASAIARQVQRIVTGIDKDQPVYDVAPLEDRIDRSLKTRRFVAWLVSASAAAGIGLAALGLYGLLSYMVGLRRREMGIRTALGATAGQITELVCRGGMALVFAGMAIGSLAAAGSHRLLASQIYGVNMADGLTWLAALGTTAAVGLLATVLPALRAAPRNPAEALRSE